MGIDVDDDNGSSEFDAADVDDEQSLISISKTEAKSPSKR